MHTMELIGNITNFLLWNFDFFFLFIFVDCKDVESQYPRLDLPGTEYKQLKVEVPGKEYKPLPRQVNQVL